MYLIINVSHGPTRGPTVEEAIKQSHFYIDKLNGNYKFSHNFSHKIL